MKVFVFILLIIIVGCSKEHGKNISFYENGNIKEKLVYNRWPDTISYEYYAYYKSGQIYRQMEYKNMIPNGVQIEYFPSGEIKKKMITIEGRKFGDLTLYNKNGTINQIKFFDSDTLVLVYNYLNDRDFEVFYIGDDTIPVGALYYNNNQINEEKSFYYITNLRDTINYNEETDFTITFINGKTQYKYMMYYIIDKLDNCEYPENLNRTTENNILHLKLIPKKKGHTVILGMLNLTNDTLKDDEFVLFHKDVFIKDDN
jgi:hypothetical protein